MIFAVTGPAAGKSGDLGRRHDRASVAVGPQSTAPGISSGCPSLRIGMASFNGRTLRKRQEPEYSTGAIRPSASQILINDEIERLLLRQVQPHLNL
jgi:hypothetical protein